jgi:hypothetical protein
VLKGVNRWEELYVENGYFFRKEGNKLLGFDSTIRELTVFSEIFPDYKERTFDNIKSKLPLKAVYVREDQYGKKDHTYFIDVEIVDVHLKPTQTKENDNAYGDYHYTIIKDGDKKEKESLYHILSLDQIRDINSKEAMSIMNTFMKRLTKATIERDYAKELFGNITIKAVTEEDKK